ncbi:MAG: hypothetical protein JXM69_13605 [Anaerolineae bacterium]|nr:hypothetical protein [Anaerolineae bacterium]
MTITQYNVVSDFRLEQMIIDLVKSTLGEKSINVNPNAPLFSSQTGFDSFALMEFVLRLEDTFGISIPDEDLDPDIFHSLRTVTVYVQARLGQEGEYA